MQSVSGKMTEQQKLGHAGILTDTHRHNPTPRTLSQQKQQQQTSHFHLVMVFQPPLPLAHEYQGGGAGYWGGNSSAARIHPLQEHRDDNARHRRGKQDEDGFEE